MIVMMYCELISGAIADFPDTVMRVISTFHPPSSVTDAIKCRLTSDPSRIHLAVTKPNRIDIYSVQSSGLQHECGAEIWGRIVTVRAIPAQVTP